MSQSQEETLFVEAVRITPRGREKQEHTYIISEAERRSLVERFTTAAPGGYGWDENRAAAELTLCQQQVWYLWKQARRQVTPQEVWSMCTEFVLDRQRTAGFDAEKTLASYMAFALSHEMKDTVGGGPLVRSGSVKDEKDRVRRQLAAATVSLSCGGDEIDGGDDRYPIPGMPSSLPIDESLIEASEAFDRELRIAAFYRFLPVLQCRVSGCGAEEAWYWRDRVRQERNPARIGVLVDPEKVALWSDAKRGAALRARSVRAGIAAFRRARGVGFCLDREQAIVDWVVHWGPKSPKKPDAAVNAMRRRTASTCNKDPATCSRCKNYGLQPEKAKQ